MLNPEYNELDVIAAYDAKLIEGASKFVIGLYKLLAKGAACGAVIGTIAGSICTLVNDSPELIAKGAAAGAFLGIYVEGAIYTVRSVHHMLK